MVFLVAYSGWIYPFMIAFLKCKPQKGLCIANSVVDLFFWIEIALTFFLAYIDPKTQNLVQDLRRIALRSVWCQCYSTHLVYDYDGLESKICVSFLF